MEEEEEEEEMEEEEEEYKYIVYIYIYIIYIFFKYMLYVTLHNNNISHSSEAVTAGDEYKPPSIIIYIYI